MKDLLILLAHLLTTIAKLLGPGGAKAVVADSLLMKQQLLIINRSRQRAPNLSVLDRFLLGFWSLFLNPRRILRAAVIIRPSPCITGQVLIMLDRRGFPSSGTPKTACGALICFGVNPFF